MESGQNECGRLESIPTYFSFSVRELFFDSGCVACNGQRRGAVWHFSLRT